MKRNTITATAVAVLLMVGLCLLMSSAQAADIYVSPSGDDKNPGTQAKPMATLEGARDMIRSKRKAKGLPRGGVTVWLADGAYAPKDSFKLTKADSGTAESPIVYRAVNGGKVEFRGGLKLKNEDWKPVKDAAILERLPKAARGKVLQIDLKAYGLNSFDPMPITGHSAGPVIGFKAAPKRSMANELFCNDKSLELARWPNTGYTTTGKILKSGARPRFWGNDIKKGDSNHVPPEKRNGKDVPSFQYRDQRHANYAKAEDPWIMIWNNFYSDMTLPIRKVDPKAKSVTLEYPLGYGLTKNKYDNTDKKYYVFNVLEELDRPGEWVLNRKTGILYCWSPVSMDKASFMFTIAKHPFFVFDDVSHVTLRGLIIDGGRAEAVIQVAGGRKVSIDVCTIKNVSGKAVDVKGGTEHRVTNCHIYNTGTGAVYMEGGDRRSLSPAGHLVENNHIHTYSRIKKSYAYAIFMTGVGHTARHNKLHDGEHAALHWKGVDHVIEYNEVFDVVRTGTDMGALMTGRDITCLGIKIRYNYIHHIINNNLGHGAQAIFLDDGTSGHHVYGNVFYRAGSNAAVKLHGGVRNIIENNIFIGNPPGAALNILTWGENFPKRVGNNFTQQNHLREVNYGKDPEWRRRWPWLASVTKVQTSTNTNQFNRNLMVNVGSTQSPRGLASESNNFETKSDPGFVNMKEEDFTLKKDSIVFRKIKGFKPIPFKKMGLSGAVGAEASQ